MIHYIEINLQKTTNFTVRYKTIKLLETRKESNLGFRARRRSPRQHKKHNP